MSTAEDAAVLLHDFVSSLDNLPSEVRFILDEIKYKEAEITKHKAKVGQKEAHMNKHFMNLGYLQRMGEGKEEVYVAKIRESYKVSERLQDEKVMLAKRGVDLLNRHLIRLHKELSKIPGAMDDMQDVVFLPPNKRSLTTQPGVPTAVTPVPSTSTTVTSGEWQAELPIRPTLNKNPSSIAVTAPLPVAAPVPPPIPPPSTPAPQPSHPISIPQLPSHAQFPVPFANPDILQALPNHITLQSGSHPILIPPMLQQQLTQQQMTQHIMMNAAAQQQMQAQAAHLQQLQQHHGNAQSQQSLGQQQVQAVQAAVLQQMQRKPGRPPRTPAQGGSGTTTPVHLSMSASLPSIPTAYQGQTQLQTSAPPKRSASSANVSRGGGVVGGRNRRSDRNLGRMVEERERGGSGGVARGRGSANSAGVAEDDDEELEEEEQGEEVDDGTLYCSCQRPSFGDMIACDYPDCPFEWFHLTCVHLDHPPTGEWFCPDCRDKGRTGRERSEDEREGVIGGLNGRRGRGTRQGRKK